MLAGQDGAEAQPSRQQSHVWCAGSSPQRETSQGSEGQHQPRGIRHSSPFASAACTMGPMAGGEPHLAGLGSGLLDAMGAGGASLHVLRACRACFARPPAQWLCHASGWPLACQQPVSMCGQLAWGFLCCGTARGDEIFICGLLLMACQNSMHCLKLFDLLWHYASVKQSETTPLARPLQTPARWAAVPVGPLATFCLHV